MTYSLHALRHLRLTIGRNIHRYRAERRIPLPKLSQLTGMPENLLDHYEIGKGTIGTEELLRIAGALRVSVEQLVA